MAQSKEAKLLGITPFAPYFKIEHLVKRHGVHVFESNFTLYGDISNRVMQTLRQYAADIEVYSIDEMFITPVTFWGDYKAYGAKLKRSVLREVGIGVSVGFAATKTLTKAANRAAKKIPALNGVCVLETVAQREWLLRRMPVGDVWGVGRKLSVRLEAMGVVTAWDLANEPPKRIRQHFSVVMERTVAELNGVSCLSLEDQPQAKQQIYSTSSFSEKLTDIEPIQQANARYIATAAHKLRNSNLVAGTLHVFLQTSPFKDNPYYESATIKLLQPTAGTTVLTTAAALAIKGLYKPRLAFSKSGVGLLDLIDKERVQPDLFYSTPVERSGVELMGVFDKINKKFGSGAIKTAAEGVVRSRADIKDNRSPRYTTQFCEIPTVKCK